MSTPPSPKSVDEVDTSIPSPGDLPLNPNTVTDESTNNTTSDAQQQHQLQQQQGVGQPTGTDETNSDQHHHQSNTPTTMQPGDGQQQHHQQMQHVGGFMDDGSGLMSGGMAGGYPHPHLHPAHHPHSHMQPPHTGHPHQPQPHYMHPPPYQHHMGGMMGHPSSGVLGGGYGHHGGVHTDGGDGSGGQSGVSEFDQANLLAAIASNQMNQQMQMISHQQRAEQDAINAAAAQAAAAQHGGGGMNMNGGNSGNGNGPEICRAYLAGRCSRGGACRFVHVDNGTGHQPTNPHLCRDWLNGTCIRGGSCRFQHQGVSGSKASIHSGGSKSSSGVGPGGWNNNSIKTVICHQWASRGRCDYGTACKFAHQRLGAAHQHGLHMTGGVGGGDRWNHPPHHGGLNTNENSLDEKKLLAAMLSGLSPQEALAQAFHQSQGQGQAQQGGNKFTNVSNTPVNTNATGGNSNTSATTGSTDSNSPTAPGQPSGNTIPSGTTTTTDSNTTQPQQQSTSPQQQQPHPQPSPSQLPLMNMGLPGPQLVAPQKRADGSLILCRFYARHGYCKYGVACKFHHQPLPMFPPYGRDPMTGMVPNQSLASLLALGLKASMIPQDHLIANHAALLAASMNGPPGVGNIPRMGSPGPMGQLPTDPALAGLLAAYLQHQQPQQQPNNFAAILQQLSNTGMPGGSNVNTPGHPGSGGNISPIQGFNGSGSDGSPFTGNNQDAAFQQFLAQQHQQQNAFQNAFSPAAASAFNAIPNLNSSSPSGPGAQNGPTNPTGGPTTQQNGLSLPQMISTAFRSTSGGANGSQGGSSLSNNLSLMSLKPFSDDATPTFNEGHVRSNSSSFNEQQSSAFSTGGLLANEQRGSYDSYGGTSGVNAVSGSQIIGPGGLNGSPNSSTSSALFSSSLNLPFLH